MTLIKALITVSHKSAHIVFKVFLLLAAVHITNACNRDSRYIEITGYTQGSIYSIKFNTNGIAETPENVAKQIDSILTCVDTTLSGFNPGSILSRYNRGEKVVPNKLFTDIFLEAKRIYEFSGHTVDVAAAPLFDLWGVGFSIDSTKSPSKEEIAEMMSVCGMDNFSGDLTHASLGQKLNYNAIAQGYTSDLIASYLHGIGVTDMLVNIGEIFCDGINPNGRHWIIAIDSPIDGNNTPGQHIQGYWHSDGKPHGVVTSGNYRRFYVRDGNKYSHTMDPRTGAPVQHNLLSATVIADNSCLADAASTACMVMGLEEAKRFLVEKGLEGCLIYDKGGKFCSWSTPGFSVQY